MEKKDGYHAALFEGYDFEKDCFVCKNSWSDETTNPRFDFDPSLWIVLKILQQKFSP